MADVKWIKITTDIFDDEKILLIESLPEADAVIVIWFKLLCLAGKQNNSGVFLMNDRIAYTDKMLATIFRRKEATVQLALETFERFGMIERVDGVITIPNWGKHQSLDQLDSRREYMRQYMQTYRAKQEQIAERKVNSKVNGKVNVNCAEEDKEKEEEKEVEREEEYNPQAVVDLFNRICASFPQVRTLSDARKRAIRARLKQYGKKDFELLFEKAEASDFLSGKNSKGWRASFDWLICDSNMAKVLDGNYDNRGAQYQAIGDWLNGGDGDV